MNFKNSFYVYSMLVMGLVSVTMCQEAAQPALNPSLKIYVEKPIVQEITADSAKGKDIVEAVPVAVNSKTDNLQQSLIQPKAQVDQAASQLLENNNKADSVNLAEIQPAQPVAKSEQKENVDSSVQLPPMPLIVPSFLSNFPPLPPFLKQLLENHKSSMSEDNNNVDLNDSSDEEDKENSDSQETNPSGQEPQPLTNNKNGIMSIFLFKSNRRPLNPLFPVDQQQEEPESENGIKTNHLLIMKILPRPLIGGDSDPDHRLG
jgi:hypothetical protein